MTKLTTAFRNFVNAPKNDIVAKSVRSLRYEVLTVVLMQTLELESGVWIQANAYGVISQKTGIWNLDYLQWTADNISSNFMFCWPWISIYACNETKLMHCLSSVYSFTILLHVSGLASCQSSGGNNVYMQQLVRVYVLVDCQLAWFDSNHASWQSTKTYKTYQFLHIYIVTSWW
jgi:hypothetical protein